jgi:hypothetical protein
LLGGTTGIALGGPKFRDPIEAVLIENLADIGISQVGAQTAKVFGGTILVAGSGSLEEQVREKNATVFVAICENRTGQFSARYLPNPQKQDQNRGSWAG